MTNSLDPVRPPHVTPPLSKNKRFQRFISTESTERFPKSDYDGEHYSLIFCTCAQKQNQTKTWTNPHQHVKVLTYATAQIHIETVCVQLFDAADDSLFMLFTQAWLSVHTDRLTLVHRCRELICPEKYKLYQVYHLKICKAWFT